MNNTKNKRIEILFVLLLASLGLCLLLLFQVDPDYFWHIKAGEYMMKHGVLRKDVFSWYVSGKYWMSHEWLFEMILYSLKCIFGKYHTLIYCYSCILGLLAILYFPNKKDFLKNIPYSLIYLLFFQLTMMGFVQARPHMLSNCLLALTIYLLTDLQKNEDSKKIYFLPLIAILWSNVHGGSSNLIYLLPFLFLIGGLFSFNFSKIEAKRLSKKQIKKCILVIFLCMISVCINIHGIKMFFYPYQNMMDKVMLNNISEWQPSNLNDWLHYIYFLLLLFILFTMLFSKKKIQFLDFLFFLFAMYLGLKSIRFWTYTIIIMTFFIFKYVSSRKYDPGTASILLFLIIFYTGFFVLASKRILSKPYKIAIEKDLITIIEKEKPKRLYNMYDWGGELIYNNIPVFIDGRADLYSKYNYLDYLNLSRLEGDYVQKIEQYDFDYFLVSDSYPIYTYLKYNDSYQIIYQKKDMILFQKK